MVYSEAKKEWLGSFNVVHIQGRVVTAQNKDNLIRKTFNSIQVKPLYRDYENSVQPFMSGNDNSSYFSDAYVTVLIEARVPGARNFTAEIEKEINGLQQQKT